MTRDLLRLEGQVRRHGASDFKKLKKYESGNRDLKQMVTEQALDIRALKRGVQDQQMAHRGTEHTGRPCACGNSGKAERLYTG